MELQNGTENPRKVHLPSAEPPASHTPWGCIPSLRSQRHSTQMGFGGASLPGASSTSERSLISLSSLPWGPRSKGYRSPNCSDLLRRMHLSWICGVSDCAGNAEPLKDEWTVSCEVITLSVRRGLGGSPPEPRDPAHSPTPPNPHEVITMSSVQSRGHRATEEIWSWQSQL